MSNMLAQSNLYFCQEREFAIGGHSKMIFANLRGPTAYETGGVKVDPQLVGAGLKGKIVWVGSKLTDSGTYRIDFKYVSLVEVRLVWTVVATGAEVANATDLDAEVLTGTPIIFIP
jgi:hypothetical protein